MNCTEFALPILSVKLLKNGTDIIYNFPANAAEFEAVALSTSASTGYAQLVYGDNGHLGKDIIADSESFSLSNTLYAKQGGYYQKVTLEYKSPSDLLNRYLFYNQQVLLRHNTYSLLIEFFDGTYGLVRTLSHGDGYLFSSKDSEGAVTNTITITNLTGIQRIASLA